MHMDCDVNPKAELSLEVSIRKRGYNECITCYRLWGKP